MNPFFRMIRDTLIITKRNLLAYFREPQLVFFSSVQSIMFVVLFNYVFGGAVAGSSKVPGGSYIDFLLPGILAQTMTFGGVLTGIGLAEDVKKGIIDRFRSLPMSRVAVIAGRTLSDTLQNLISILIIIVAGYILGFRFQNSVPGAVEMIGIMLLFVYTMSWIFASVGIFVHKAETVQQASFVIIFPLTFASAIFVPVQTMPNWLQVFAKNQPVTFLAEAARSFALGTPDDGASWKILLWVVALLVVFIPLSVWQYKRSA